MRLDKWHATKRAFKLPPNKGKVRWATIRQKPTQTLDCSANLRAAAAPPALPYDLASSLQLSIRAVLVNKSPVTTKTPNSKSKPCFLAYLSINLDIFSCCLSAMLLGMGCISDRSKHVNKTEHTGEKQKNLHCHYKLQVYIKCCEKMMWNYTSHVKTHYLFYHLSIIMCLTIFTDQ